MSMHYKRLTKEQNFCVHYDGVKTNGSTVQKNKGGLRGRKALNDISNSKNVIPIGEDLGVSKKAQIPVGGKAQISDKKTQVSGRKALGDLTNLVKPFGQQQGIKKLIAVAEDEDEDEYENLPYSIAQEGFLHNHEECIKSQKNSMDLHHFLKTIGLDEDVSCQSVSAYNTSPRKSMDEDLIMLYGMEEIPIPTIEDPPRQYNGQSSPIFGSPDSPRWPCMSDWDDIPNFILRFGQLQDVDLQSIEPAIRADTEAGSFREDSPETFDKREAMIADVPSYEKPYIKVPKVLNKD